MTTVFFIGHHTNAQMIAGAGLGHVLNGALCMAFCFGMNGTLESKVSQAFGAKNYEMCGLWLKRGRTINSCLMLPISILFFNSSRML